MGIRKRIGTLIIALSMFLTITAQASQQPQTIEVTNVTPIQYLFDGVFYEPPAGQEGFLYQNWTYVPLRFMAEMLGSVVEWDSETYTVIIRYPETEEEKQQVASNQLERKAINQSPSKEKPAVRKNSIKIYATPVKYIFFNEEITPGSEWIGINFNGRIYVPLRFVTESMGWEVEFEQETFTIRADAPGSNEESGEGVQDAAQAGNEGQVLPGGAGGQAPPGGMGGGGAPPAGPGPVGGGGGGKQPSDAYAEIIFAHEKQLSDLKLSCMSKVYNLYTQYLKADDPDERNDLIDQGWIAEAECDASFEGIMSSLQSQLSSIGTGKDAISGLISGYRQEYEAEKQNLLMQFLK